MNLPKRKITALFLALGLLLSSVAAFLLGNTADVARANPSAPKFSVDYTTTGLVEGQYYEKSNVVTDTNGHAAYGVVPSNKWEAQPTFQDGYITYKIQSANGELLTDVKLSFNAYFGCAGLSDYYGENKTNLRVKVSQDNVNFIEVTNLHEPTGRDEYFTMSVTDAKGQSGITVGQTDAYGNRSIVADYYVDLSASESVGKTDVLYIKLDIQHLSKSELTTSADIYLGHAGVMLYSVAIDYTETEDTSGKSYSDDVSFDFNEAQYAESTYEWNTIAYDFAGLSIQKDVDYVLEDLGSSTKVSTLAPSSGNSTGYITFKFKAPSGQRFQTLTITSIARLFDNNTPPTGKVNYYIGTSVSQYFLAYESTITGWKGANATTPRGNTPVNQINVDRFVRGREVFFVKVEIGVGSDKTWTNLKELSFDVGFEATDVSYSDDVSFDFSESQYAESGFQWNSIATEASGLSIVNNVFYRIDGTDGNYNALAPASTKSEGYLVFRFVAPTGKAFRSLSVTTLARLFDYLLAGTHEKLDLYVSTDPLSEGECVYRNEISSFYANCPRVTVDCDRYIYGEEEFYVKVVIGCSNDRTWTNLKELSFDVEYEQIDLTVNYGAYYQEVVKHEKGSEFQGTVPAAREGYYLLSQTLYTDSACTQAYDGSVIAADTQLYVQCVKADGKLTYVLNGGTNHASNPVYYDSTAEVTLAEPTKTGYLFDGWYFDENCTLPFMSIAQGRTGDITVYAKWVSLTPPTVTGTISYELDGGTNASANPATYTYGEAVALQEPTKENYSFLEWRLNSPTGTAVTEISSTVTGNVTLYAVWQADSYRITYVLNGGTNASANPATYTYGEAVVFAEPTKDGYTFDGWYIDEDCELPILSIAQGRTGDITVYANWISNTPPEVDYFGTVSYVLDGGTNGTGNPAAYIYGDVHTLANPTKEGYTFVEWRLNSATGTKITEIGADMTGDITLYAIWEKASESSPTPTPTEPAPPTEPIEPTEPTPPSTEETGGCKGSLGTGAGVVAFTLVGAAAISLLKKKGGKEE